MSLRLTVIVPTWNRPEELSRCLRALAGQTLPADQVLAVVREGDWPTVQAVEAARQLLPALARVPVSVPGQIAAMNAGLEAATGDVVAFTDDDAAPRPDWLQRIEAHYAANPRVGAVGGRDWIHHGDQVVEGSADLVGTVQWFGRVVGNHHLGVGGPREVDVLKGACLSFRRAALGTLRFDERLLGAGAQVHNELSVCLPLRRRGWTILYDPAVAVDHYEASRSLEGRVGHFDADALAVFNASYNEALMVWEHVGPLRRGVFVAWSLLVGTTRAPGLVQAIRFTPRWGRHAWRRFAATQRGKFRCFLGPPGNAAPRVGEAR